MSLDTSSEGPAIQKSIKSIVNNSLSGAKSPTYATWLVLYVQTPLKNAFSSGPAKPSVLKVQGVGDGELADLFEDFNDGRVQFALAKVKDSNTGLGKNVFFAWCGEGVPEHVKGNYTSFTSTVGRLFEGYHVQINARSTDDLNVDAIISKVAKASGSNYSAATSAPASESSTKPPPPVASKPGWKPGQAYTPTKSYSNPAALPRRAQGAVPVGNVDQDGWGEDAPAPTKNSLEKVSSAYKPTKVNMNELLSQPTSTTDGSKSSSFERPDVVRGAYQPIGKVDIAAIRAQGDKKFDSKPELVKGAYQPTGKVDIAAIRAKAQAPEPVRTSTPKTDEQDDEPKSLTDRASAFTQQPSSTSSSSFGRLQSLPKPKPTKAFGTGGSGAFTGTKPLTGFGSAAPTIAATAPIGTANKDFASQGGKTPAQIWQEKKARERGLSGASESAPMPSMSTGRSVEEDKPTFSSNRTGGSDDVDEGSQSGGVSALRDRFKGMPMPSTDNAPSMPTRPRDPSPPPAPMASKPVPQQQQYEEEEEEEEEEQRAAAPALSQRSVPPPPVQQQRSPSPSPPSSPVRIVMPVARATAQRSPSPEIERPKTPSPELVPVQPMAAAAMASHGGSVELTGRRAKVIYDYEKAEDGEISLVDGEIVGMIEMVDEDWWQGTNQHGETGLFPSNYVEPIMGPDDEEDEEESAQHHQQHQEEEDEPEAAHAASHTQSTSSAGGGGGQKATAIYDYEAAEENELSFPEGAIIENIEFPDEDWWTGRYKGDEGLFPANYVELIK